jgi:HEAT repeat protein
MLLLLAGSQALAQSTLPAATDLLPYGQINPPKGKVHVIALPRTIELIDEAIKEEEELARRVELTTDLGKCISPASEAILKRLLADPAPLIRAAAVRSLVAINAADPATLKPLLSDPSAYVRAELIRAKFPEAIIAGLKDADESLQGIALGISVNADTDRAIADQIKSLQPWQAGVAVSTLANRNYTDGVPAIRPLLGSNNVVARVSAIRALAKLRAIDRNAIETQLSHSHAAVRVAAIQAAMTLANADRVVIADRMIADADLAVRVPAVQLYGSVGEAKAASVLFDQLTKGYAPLREASRQALVAIARATPSSEPEMIRLAAELLSHADADRRIDGSFLLGQLKSEAQFDVHVKLLDDADWRVVEQAARSLGLIGRAQAGDALVATVLRSVPDPKRVETMSPEELAVRSTAGEQAVLSAVLLKHTPILAATRQFHLSKTAPTAARFASIYAMGVLGSPEEVNQSLSPMLGRTRDPEESSQAIVEAIKAYGNSRAKAGVSALQRIIAGENSDEFKYTAHLAIDRINGQSTVFVVADMTLEPDTSIRALE